MKLYHHPASNNSRKVRAVFRHLGLEVEEGFVDLMAGGGQAPEYLALNPMGKVPTLVDGETVLWESNAICCYLASKAANDLWPRSAARYEILRWLFWENAHFASPIGIIAFQRLAAPHMGKDPDEALIEREMPKFMRFTQVLEDHLEGREWIVGDGPTLADFAIGASAALIAAAGLPIENFPNVARFVAALDEIPAWQETAS